MKTKLTFASLLLFFTSSLFAQKLLIHDLDAAGLETGIRTVEVGDMIVVAHQKKPGKTIRYFQGKVTGIFPKRGKIRVFDYGRSTRIFSIVGKKIPLTHIVGVKPLAKDAYETRENRAVVTSIVSAVGGGIGGPVGNTLEAGASAANFGNDLLTREQLSKQRIKVEFAE